MVIAYIGNFILNVMSNGVNIDEDIDIDAMMKGAKALYTIERFGEIESILKYNTHCDNTTGLLRFS